jgi:hypothetical protein
METNIIILNVKVSLKFHECFWLNRNNNERINPKIKMLALITDRISTKKNISKLLYESIMLRWFQTLRNIF